MTQICLLHKFIVEIKTYNSQSFSMSKHPYFLIKHWDWDQSPDKDRWVGIQVVRDNFYFTFSFPSLCQALPGSGQNVLTLRTLRHPLMLELLKLLLEIVGALIAPSLHCHSLPSCHPQITAPHHSSTSHHVHWHVVSLSVVYSHFTLQLYSVRISAPFSVIRTVCSTCAVLLLSWKVCDDDKHPEAQTTDQSDRCPPVLQSPHSSVALADTRLNSEHHTRLHNTFTPW